MSSSDSETAHSIASSSKVTLDGLQDQREKQQSTKARRPSGKKGKKFVEEKTSLLGLVDMITASKDDERSAKLNRSVKASEAINAQSKTKAQRKLERTAPLRATKKLILEKEKARKAQRKDKKKQLVVVPRAAGAGEEAAAKPKKKGVSFA